MAKKSDVQENVECEVLTAQEVMKITGNTNATLQTKMARGEIPKPIPSESRTKQWRKSDIYKYVGKSQGQELKFDEIPPNLARFMKLLVIEGVQQGIENVLNTPR
ncbi:MULTISPECIES: helix-turn-helix transcriptional regulator [Pseudoalteromonas]|uniref:DNA-binding protein n=1 Tax=Pseudoalteromonas obscura TaxID=3048491 RepID=A0ABT7EHB2_9GAMM|nr:MULTISPECIES: hypothetical protein [Pseudoalteromonas]MBQ4836084.1 hypothetical protein [Pseudoalteromonas luteoviolacea]MDK2594431.1 hypothetical protein [Pseudoalteromonas sp. P94(2023)]